MNNWHVAINGQSYGPYTQEQVRNMLQSGYISEDTLVWCGEPGYAERGWVRAGDAEFSDWYYTINGQIYGPFSEVQMKSIFLSDQISGRTLVRCNGAKYSNLGWISANARELKEFWKRSSYSKDISKIQNDIDYDKNWRVDFSFGKSESKGYEKALSLSRELPTYEQKKDNDRLVHTASCTAKPDEFLKFCDIHHAAYRIRSYKVAVNGKWSEKKWHINMAVGCYGEKCLSTNKDFCYRKKQGSPSNFWGCWEVERQMAWADAPLFWRGLVHSFESCKVLYVNKKWLKEQIDKGWKCAGACPAFDHKRMIQQLKELPKSMTRDEYLEFCKKLDIKNPRECRTMDEQMEIDRKVVEDHVMRYGDKGRVISRI